MYKTRLDMIVIFNNILWYGADCIFLQAGYIIMDSTKPEYSCAF